MTAAWREIGDGGPWWDRFEEIFEFRPDFYETERPAIRIPSGSSVVDLSPVFSADPAGYPAGCAAVQAAAIRSFIRVFGDADLVALDWQHTCYLWSPSRHTVTGEPPAVPVFPDGDYYIHMSRDLRSGTCGHPWQQTLTVWGADLVGTLGRDLATWLPVHRVD